MRIKEFITICLLLVSVSLFAQEKIIEVTGVVTDTNKEPLVGVNVTVKDKPGLGAITDINGRYKIKIEEFSRLVFSYIGFDTQEILVKRQSLVNVSMKESEAREIDEVVITGTGAQKKLTVTGAVTNVDVEVLKSNPSANLSNALAGNVSGVLAMQTSGQPGVNTSEFWIRGISTFGANSSALVLVDGFERDLDEINIEDIESFTVLKDASTTAIYGPRGANGVVLITTKHGKEGKIKINAKVETSYNARTITPEFADGYSYAMLMNEARITRNQERIYQNDEMELLRLGLDPDLYPNVDWMDVLLKDGAMTYRANLNMSGGTDYMKYFASVGYQGDGDIYKLKKNDSFDPRHSYKRYNWRSNFDFNITKSTKLSINVAGKMAYRNKALDDSNPFYAILTSPTSVYPVKYSDGEWGDDTYTNPVANMNMEGANLRKTFQGWYDASLEQKLDFITKGLKVNAKVSYSSSSTTSTATYLGTEAASQAFKYIIRYSRTYDYANPIIGEDGQLTYPMLESKRLPYETSVSNPPFVKYYDQLDAYSRRFYYEFSIAYNRSFGDHNVSALALVNRQIFDSKDGGDIRFPNYNEDWVGRATYNWRERYLAEMNISYTGSEKFARGHRFGLFPSFSLGWRLSEESFIKKHLGDVLTNAKIRYSWGKVGSDAGASRWNYIQSFTSGDHLTLGTDATGHNWGPLYTEGSIANLGSTWEKSTKQNLGIEIGLWNKLSLTLDLFDEKRRDILMTPNTTSSIAGATFNSLNIGKTKNHGIELELRWDDKIGKDFHYYANFTMASSENRIVFQDDPYKAPDHLKKAGKPIGHQARYLAIGNYGSIDDVFNYAQSGTINSISPNQVIPGDLVYIDFDANGILNGQDKVAVDQLNYPLHTYGLDLGFNWRGLSFSAMIYAPTGVWKLVDTVYASSFKGGRVNAQPGALNTWSPETASSSGIQRPSLHLKDDGGFNGTESTWRYRNFSYLRLKNVEVSYQLPKRCLTPMRISSLQVYVTGNNLLTFWGGDNRIDPEGNQTGYPILRSVTSGIRLSF